jgi:hypothetical protein
MFSPSGLRCFVYLDWYVLSVWNDMFCSSGLRCFVYLDWYVLSIWNAMFYINPDSQNILILMDRTNHSRQTKTYQSRQTKHSIPDRQNISCFIYLDWYVLYVWNDMFCLSGLRCFVYLDWYVLSVWNDMFCLSGMICSPSGLKCFVYLDWYVLYISLQINKTYQSR